MAQGILRYHKGNTYRIETCEYCIDYKGDPESILPPRDVQQSTYTHHIYILLPIKNYLFVLIHYTVAIEMIVECFILLGMRSLEAALTNKAMIANSETIGRS
jgi:hypothetical protein